VVPDDCAYEGMGRNAVSTDRYTQHRAAALHARSARPRIRVPVPGVIVLPAG
jgi:hypothetical protein